MPPSLTDGRNKGLQETSWISNKQKMIVSQRPTVRTPQNIVRATEAATEATYLRPGRMHQQATDNQANAASLTTCVRFHIGVDPMATMHGEALSV